MQTYLKLVQDVLENGSPKSDRTGTGTISLFGDQRKYDLREGFPLLTTKKVRYSSVLRELLWFLKGSTNIHDELSEYTSIWNPWADSKGDLGPVYGYQWRFWEVFVPDEENPNCFRKTHYDQIYNVLHLLKTQPYSRRMIVSAWNVADLNKMALPPCHTFFQLSVQGDRLDLHLYQRSADIALGVPYNIASYATLLQMMAQECGYEPGIFIHTIGDAHIYQNHREGLEEQLMRKPLPLPHLVIAKRPFEKLTFNDFSLLDYHAHPTIRFPIAV